MSGVTPRDDAPQAAPEVSIIIPAFNEERWLPATLRGLRELAAADSREIIVVDNGSTDRTRDLAREAGATVLLAPGVSVAALRNAGARVAAGDVLAFLDADCVPQPDWLEKALRSIRDGPCVTGARVLTPPNGTWVERAWFDVAPQGRRRVSYINSGNLIVSRLVFAHVGGFDESLATGEDSDFCRRASAVVPVVADDTIRVHHYGNPRTVRAFFRRERWHGVGGAARGALTWRNKPLVGGLLWLTLTLGQVAGLGVMATGGGPWVLAGATAGILVLCTASGLHRNRWRPTALAAQAAMLFYVYYAARSMSALQAWLGGRAARGRAA